MEEKLLKRKQYCSLRFVSASALSQQYELGQTLAGGEQSTVQRGFFVVVQAPVKVGYVFHIDTEQLVWVRSHSQI